MDVDARSHVSNLYYCPPQERVADRERGWEERGRGKGVSVVFYVNSPRRDRLVCKIPAPCRAHVRSTPASVIFTYARIVRARARNQTKIPDNIQIN